MVTTNTTGGYLLTSRSHYSANAVLTEHFTRHTDFGVDYVTVTAILEDGGQTRITSSTFKKEPDGSKFETFAWADFLLGLVLFLVLYGIYHYRRPDLLIMSLASFGAYGSLSMLILW